MAAASISPIAPARVGALLVPVGNLKKSRFEAFVERLRPENVVRLGDISPDQRSDRNTFSPLAFPNGVILYDISTSQVPSTQQELFPFELHRNQLVILGLIDGHRDAPNTYHSGASTEQADEVSAETLAEDQKQLESQYPHALAVQLIIFDCISKVDSKSALTVPPKGQSRSTTMKTVMCDVSSKVLSEMSVFAKSIQAEDSLPSPTLARTGYPVPYLMRHDSLRESVAKQSLDSDAARPDRTSTRTLEDEERRARVASSPVPALAASTLPSRERSRSPMSHGISSPPRGASPDLKHRPTDSVMSRIRDNSRNRSSVHGLPSMSPSERAKNMVKLRQGLILGNLHLLAGRWSDALRELVDNTTRAKVFSDHIWYAKGMENILATMILLAWARLDFTIPSICFSVQERSASLKHVPSSNLVRSSQSLDLSDGAASRTLSNMTMVLPEMVTSIVSHYRRDDGIDSAGLAQLPFSECVIRLSYMIAVLQRTGGQLTERMARFLVLGSPDVLSSRLSQRSLGMQNLHNADIAGLIFQAFPAELQASYMPLDDVISILSGIISVLSMAKLHRKRAMIIREALSLLIPRLIQARKVGAAEMGIHPAASLAARHGLTIDAASGAPLLASGSKDIDFHDLLVVLCETFGVPGVTGSDHRKSTSGLETSESLEDQKLEARQRNFGGFDLKTEILRLCANFSESLPDFHDVVQFTTAVLRTAGPGSAAKPDMYLDQVKLPRDDQLRFATKINRTLGVFKAEDAAQLESDYWDPFLVRDVSVKPAASPNLFTTSGQLYAANKVKLETANDAHLSNGAGNVTTLGQPSTLVAGESTQLVFSLQNLYDFEISIESFEVLSEGVKVSSEPVACVLQPKSIQQFHVKTTAAEAGDFNIAGCLVKVQGCKKQIFGMFPEAWRPMQDIKIKSHGLKGLYNAVEGTSDPGDKALSPVARTFKVVDAQPRLVTTTSSLAHGSTDIMDGETKNFFVTVRNSSKTITTNFVHFSMDYEYDKETHAQPSTRSAFKDWSEPITWRDENILRPIAPGETAALSFSVCGHIGLQKAYLRVDHGHFDPEQHETADPFSIHTRRLIVPVRFSVHPSIRILGIETLSKAQMIAIDVSNLSASSLDLSVTSSDSNQTDTIGSRAEAGQSARLLVPLETFAKPEPAQSILVQWREPSSGRHGNLPIDRSAINAVMAQLPQPSAFAVSLSLEANEGGVLPPDTHGVGVATLDQFLKFKATVKNISNTRQKAIMIIVPRAAGADLDEDELGKQLAWTGSLRRGVKVEAGAEQTEELGVVVMGRGAFEIVVELRPAGSNDITIRQALVFRADWYRIHHND